jgi:leader peptidase (prepilin peptidase) / N-methyltransferase
MALALAATAAGLVGLAIGSFLGVLVLRLPRGRPVAMARSACTQCGRVLGPGELVPVVSWLVQGRRCRGCGTKLALFYPAIELASGAVAAAAVVLVPWPLSAAACLAGWGLVGLIALAVTHSSC